MTKEHSVSMWLNTSQALDRVFQLEKQCQKSIYILIPQSLYCGLWKFCGYQM